MWLRSLWDRRPWGYPIPKEGEMLIGIEILPIALGRVVVEARKVRPTPIHFVKANYRGRVPPELNWSEDSIIYVGGDGSGDRNKEL